MKLRDRMKALLREITGAVSREISHSAAVIRSGHARHPVQEAALDQARLGGVLSLGSAVPREDYRRWLHRQIERGLPIGLDGDTPGALNPGALAFYPKAEPFLDELA